ncbi:hypothetical protein MICA_2233 [Micavibrio aeruginosavorus ARL-13]|uniref:Uncharacterized protein n=1 Tax=Micavibrio aeruginosavorus (strain ARL-13) TaxID=856793 RepID=G2KS28_MICAA|nr:hypothetical protein MICA_2233 [Micavibrio aeruginosavorus ARL-13]
MNRGFRVPHCTCSTESGPENGDRPHSLSGGLFFRLARVIV